MGRASERVKGGGLRVGVGERGRGGCSFVPVLSDRRGVGGRILPSWSNGLLKGWEGFELNGQTDGRHPRTRSSDYEQVMSRKKKKEY
jgi:hypothetical protein